MMRVLAAAGLLTLAAATAASAQSGESCDARGRHPSVSAAVAFSGTDVLMSDAAVPPSPDAQFRARHGIGAAAAAEFPFAPAWALRVEASGGRLGIDRIPFTGNDTSSAGLDPVKVTEFLAGVTRRARGGHKVCFFGHVDGGVHHFSYGGTGASGASFAAGAGADVALGDPAAIFFEVRLSVQENGGRPPLTSESVFSGSAVVGIRYWFR